MFFQSDESLKYGKSSVLRAHVAWSRFEDRARWTAHQLGSVLVTNMDPHSAAGADVRQKQRYYIVLPITNKKHLQCQVEVGRCPRLLVKVDSGSSDPAKKMLETRDLGKTSPQLTYTWHFAFPETANTPPMGFQIGFCA